MDYSKLSDSDLVALKRKDYAKMSDSGLLYVRDQRRGAAVSSDVKASPPMDEPSGIDKAKMAAPFFRDWLEQSSAFQGPNGGPGILHPVEWLKEGAQSLLGMEGAEPYDVKSKKVFGGAIHGASLGLLHPWADEPTRPATPEETASGTKPPTIGESGAYQAGDLVGTLAPYELAAKGISMIPKIGSWLSGADKVRTLGDLGSNVGKAAVRGTLLGGGVGEARQGMNYLSGEPTSQMEPVKDAAFFAALDAGLSALGGVGKLMKAAMMRGRYAEAEKLYREATAGKQTAYPEVESYLAEMQAKPLALPAPANMGEGFTLGESPRGNLLKRAEPQPRAFINDRVVYDNESMPAGPFTEASRFPKDIYESPLTPLSLPAPEGKGEGFTMRPVPHGQVVKPRAFIDNKVVNAGEPIDQTALFGVSGRPGMLSEESVMQPETNVKPLSGEAGEKVPTTTITQPEVSPQVGTTIKKPTEVPPAHRAKEAWEMNKEEWDAEFNKMRPSGQGAHQVTAAANIGKSVKGANKSFSDLMARQNELKMGLPDIDSETGLPWAESPKQGLQIPARHRQVIEYALSQNKPVPASVLAEYPELAKKYGGGSRPISSQSSGAPLQAAAGAASGFYYDKDEKKWKYNPVAGALGAVAGVAIGRVAGRESKLTENKPTVRPEEVIRTEKYDLTPEAKARLEDAAKAIGPKLEKIKQGPLTHDEVIEAAKGAEILRGETTRKEALKIEAMLYRTKEHLNHLAETEGQLGASADLVQALKNISTLGTYGGRLVESMKLSVTPEGYAGTRIDIIKKLLKAGADADAITEAAKGINFNDAEQVTAFYRQFVKPKLGEIIDEYRYINLLSSPRTHIVNAFSNALQVAGLRPATRLVSGAVDNVASAMTGRTREYYIRQVPAYYKGVINSVPKALTDAWDIMLGKSQIRRPDLEHMPTGSKLVKWGQPIPRALEAMDVLFQTIAAGGEVEALAKRARITGREISQTELQQLGKQEAQKLVFRSKLDPSNETGQGYILSKMDAFTNYVGQGRKFAVIKWFVPFIQTPTQILKQGLEYSPAGLMTLPKNAAKLEQLSKAVVGSTVFAGAGALALQGRTTWAVPRNAKLKEAFYAAGMQPYSVKIGDKWYSYSKLGPLAYPIAMAAGLKQAFDDNPNALTETQMEKVKNGLAGIAQFFADQSYVQGMQSLFNAVSGKEGGFTEALTQAPQQMIPLEALQGWVANMVDPIYRKGNTELSGEAILDQLKKKIPGLSKSVEPYTNNQGQPSPRPAPIANAVSPVGISPEKPAERAQYTRLAELQQLSKYQQAQDEAGKTPAQKVGSTDRAIAQLERETSIWQFKQEVKRGDKTNVLAALKSGTISGNDYNDIMRHKDDTPEVSAFRSLPLELAVNAYNASDKSQKKTYRSIIGSKWNYYVKNSPRKDIERMRPLVVSILTARP